MTWNQRWIAKVLLVRWLSKIYNTLLLFMIVAGLGAMAFIGEAKAKIHVRHVFYALAIGSFFACAGCAIIGRFLMGWRSSGRSVPSAASRARAMGAGR
jgi:hypothetical protein